MAPRLLLSLLLLIVSFIGCVRGGRSGFGPGDAPPEIVLPDLNQRTRSISEFKGKVVLLNFWASWCAPCVAEMPSLERLYNHLKDDGFVIVAIGVDDDEKLLREFKERFNLTFPILVDPDGRSKFLFGVTGVPESFLIDRSGKFVLFQDPQDNIPRVRLIGEREWDSPNAVRRIKELLKQ